jgi:uncharacterized membrane protein YdjX (TVP38/TMEM64 family)
MATSFHTKLTIIIVGIIGLVLTPYFLWHEQMDAYFVSEPYQAWLVSIKPYAWLIGLSLIIADLFLPIPVPPVMATLGALYGTAVGGAVATIGSILSGMLAYGLARLAGRRGARWLASDRELSDFQRFFDTWGVAGIVASRALPVLPEVLTLLAGLARMRFGRFMLSLVVGATATGMAIAWVGQAAGQSSTLLLVMTVVPAGLWCIYLVFARKLQSLPQSHRQVQGTVGQPHRRKATGAGADPVLPHGRV